MHSAMPTQCSNRSETCWASDFGGHSVGCKETPRASSLFSESKKLVDGGESGIRTHDTVSRIHAFQACAFSHSAISPAPIVRKRAVEATPPRLFILWAEHPLRQTSPSGSVVYTLAAFVLQTAQVHHRLPAPVPAWCGAPCDPN